MTYEDHKRWRIPFIGRGAHGATGGHVRILGVEVCWLAPESWRPNGVYSIELFRLIAFRRNGPGWDWSVAMFEIKFRKASWRFGEREAARERRASKRRIDALIAKQHR